MIPSHRSYFSWILVIHSCKACVNGRHMGSDQEPYSTPLLGCNTTSYTEDPWTCDANRSCEFRVSVDGLYTLYMTSSAADDFNYMSIQICSRGPRSDNFCFGAEREGTVTGTLLQSHDYRIKTSCSIGEPCGMISIVSSSCVLLSTSPDTYHLTTTGTKPKSGIRATALTTDRTLPTYSSRYEDSPTLADFDNISVGNTYRSTTENIAQDGVNNSGGSSDTNSFNSGAPLLEGVGLWVVFALALVVLVLLVVAITAVCRQQQRWKRSRSGRQDKSITVNHLLKNLKENSFSMAAVPILHQESKSSIVKQETKSLAQTTGPIYAEVQEELHEILVTSSGQQAYTTAYCSRGTRNSSVYSHLSPFGRGTRALPQSRASALYYSLESAASRTDLASSEYSRLKSPSASGRASHATINDELPPASECEFSASIIDRESDPPQYELPPKFA